MGSVNPYSDEAIGKSPVIHFVYGSQGKKVNPKSIAVNTKAAKLHPGDTKKVKAKVKWPAGKTALGHVKSKVRFMSTDDEVATVSSKGVITAKAAGTCKVYAYAENGLWKTINVTVE